MYRHAALKHLHNSISHQDFSGEQASLYSKYLYSTIHTSAHRGRLWTAANCKQKVAHGWLLAIRNITIEQKQRLHPSSVVARWISHLWTDVDHRHTSLSSQCGVSEVFKEGMRTSVNRFGSVIADDHNDAKNPRWQQKQNHASFSRQNPRFFPPKSSNVFSPKTWHVIAIVFRCLMQEVKTGNYPLLRIKDDGDYVTQIITWLITCPVIPNICK